MSRFNFNNVIPQTPDIDPVLPKFTDKEVLELLNNCEFESQDLDSLKSILHDGKLKSLSELHNVFDAHKENRYYKSFKPNSAQSLRDAADMIDLINDINMIMCLDRNVQLNKTKKFIWTEIRLIQITENTKRLVLGMSVNTKEQVTHSKAWGYTKKGNNNNTNNNKGADPFA